jgi:hypothetical protein
MCYIHKSFFNGWRLHAACICSVNVIVPPPCSTRPNEQPSAAASLSTEPCPGRLLLVVVRESLFSSFPSHLQFLSRHFQLQPATSQPTRRDTRPNISPSTFSRPYQTLGPSSTVQHLWYRRLAVAASQALWPFKNDIFELTAIPQ